MKPEVSPVLSPNAIRSAFPALRRSHNGFPVAYFDGPGGTQVPTQVVDAMTDYLYHHNANTHWHYPTSEETDRILLNARRSASQLLNCEPAEIVFGANMTTLTFHLSRSIGRTLNSGDEIVVTELDHHANIAPWSALQKERGVVIRTVPMIPETGLLDMDRLQQLVGPRTRLVAIGAASNALGTINDIDLVTQIAHEAGALVFVDAVHFTPHVLPDVRAIDCDFLACSAYKFYGPHVGILYARHQILEQLDVPKLIPAPDSAPERIETGTLNHEGIAGAGAAIDFLASIRELDGAELVPATREALKESYSTLHRLAVPLFQLLWDGIGGIAGVHRYGPSPDQPRTPTISFTVDGHSAADVCQFLSSKGLFASDGDFYAATVVKRLGVEALVRVGCACYSTEEEIDRIVSAVHALAGA